MRAWWTGRADGDQRALGDGRPPPPPVPSGLSVRRLTQVHGGTVVAVDPGPTGAPGLVEWAPGPRRTAPEGDALVATGQSTCLAILTADCGAVALGSAEGVHGAVHAGWRGLLAGVVQHAVGAIRSLGAGEVVAAFGPCIHPCCYEFSPADLDVVAARYGDTVRGQTRDGRPALDLPAALRAALAEAGASVVAEHGACTSCGPDAFSFRRWGDDERQAMLVWRVPTS